MSERVRPQISITVNAEVLEEADKVSKRIGINRSQLINNILVMGLGDVRLLEKVGLIDLARAMRSFQSLGKKEFGIA